MTTKRVDFLELLKNSKYLSKKNKKVVKREIVKRENRLWGRQMSNILRRSGNPIREKRIPILMSTENFNLLNNL